MLLLDSPLNAPPSPACLLQVLEACGMAELAAEAREALAQMCGGAAPPV